MKTRKVKPVESHIFAGMESAVSAQASAAAELAGEDLTAIMQQPGRDISADAGEMERESPLFFGTGDNPALF